MTRFQVNGRVVLDQQEKNKAMIFEAVDSNNALMQYRNIFAALGIEIKKIKSIREMI